MQRTGRSQDLVNAGILCSDTKSGQGFSFPKSNLLLTHPHFSCVFSPYGLLDQFQAWLASDKPIETQHRDFA